MSLHLHAAVDVSTSSADFNVTSQIEVAQSSVLQRDPSQLTFNKIHNSKIVQGYSDLDLWMKIQFFNSSDQTQKRLLYFDAPLIGRLMAIEMSSLGTETIEETGPGFPLLQRAVPVRWAAFNIHLAPKEEKTYFIKRSSHHALNTQAYISDEVHFSQNEAQTKAIFFFYLGGIVCLIVYNIVLGISTRQKDYLVYSAFAGSFALAALSLHNVLDTYLFPNQHIVFSAYLMFFSSLGLLSATFFVERFLNIGRNFSVGYFGLRVLRIMAVPPLVGSLFVPYFRGLYFLGYWIDVTIAMALVFFIFCGIYTLVKFRYALSYYFLISWVAVMGGVLIWIAALHGLIQTSPWTQYSLLIANLGEMLILALGLAYKIKIMDDEKRQALRAAADKDRYHRLVKVLSHDVANTVSGVVFHTETLDSLSKDSESKEHIGRIGRLTDRLSEILNTVRAEEVFNSVKSQAHLEKVELRQACVDAIEHFSWELKEKEIQIELNVPPGISVHANRSAVVNQILVNVLSNCIKFSDSGSRVSLYIEETAKDVALLVCDQGVGIPHDRLQDLFEGSQVFSRSGTAQEMGTGFGTKLIGEYMKLFGGKARVQSVYRTHSDVNSGTTVHLIFPK